MTTSPAECPVGVDYSERVEGSVHGLRGGGEVDQDGEAEVGQQAAEAGVDQCPQPGQLGAPLAGLRRLRLGRQLSLADNGGHLRDGGLGEGGGEKLVIEIPDRWSHC